MHFCAGEPVLAVWIWILSASLDLIDGPLARALQQTSSLGILLDIASDNILRTTAWIAAVTVEPSYALVACILISLEWTTMICTQLHSREKGGEHWKTTRECDPWIVRAIFANNFKTPLGSWCIYGLFSAPFFAYGDKFEVFHNNIPYFSFWKNAAFAGRAISLLVELRMTSGYVSLVVERDTAAA